MLAAILSLDSFYLDTFYLDTFAAAGFYLYIFVVAAFYLDTFGVAGCREAVHRVILKILRCTKRLPPISAPHFTILNIALVFFRSEKIRPWRILTDGFRACGF